VLAEGALNPEQRSLNGARWTGGWDFAAAIQTLTTVKDGSTALTIDVIDRAASRRYLLPCLK
jgi:hypothetical protein